MVNFLKGELMCGMLEISTLLSTQKKGAEQTNIRSTPFGYSLCESEVVGLSLSENPHLLSSSHEFLG
jgi:hypothetical protein